MKRNMLRAAVVTAAMLTALPASAAITFDYDLGADPYAGPTPTFDFDGSTPATTGGLITSGSLDGIRAQPFGSTGNYFTVGPSDGSPGEIDISGFASITTLSLLWGSIDSYNTISFLDDVGNILGSFTGTEVFALADGDQSDPATNPIVTFSFTGADRDLVSRIRLESSQNAFEIDNLAITAVPEPGTWAMMLAGFGAVGYSLRSRKSRRLAQAV